jgi:hypothetical protein
MRLTIDRLSDPSEAKNEQRLQGKSFPKKYHSSE